MNCLFLFVMSLWQCLTKIPVREKCCSVNLNLLGTISVHIFRLIFAFSLFFDPAPVEVFLICTLFPTLLYATLCVWGKCRTAEIAASHLKPRSSSHQTRLRRAERLTPPDKWLIFSFCSLISHCFFPCTFCFFYCLWVSVDVWVCVCRCACVAEGFAKCGKGNWIYGPDPSGDGRWRTFCCMLNGLSVPPWRTALSLSVCVCVCELQPLQVLCKSLYAYWPEPVFISDFVSCVSLQPSISLIANLTRSRANKGRQQRDRKEGGAVLAAFRLPDKFSLSCSEVPPSPASLQMASQPHWASNPFVRSSCRKSIPNLRLGFTAWLFRIQSNMASVRIDEDFSSASFVLQPHFTGVRGENRLRVVLGFAGSQLWERTYNGR